MWAERFPKELQEFAPTLVTGSDPSGGEYEALLLEGVEYRQYAHSVGVPIEEYENANGLSLKYDDGLEGNRDPKARVDDMAVDAIDAAVMVRNNFPQFQPKDLRIRWGMIRAFNDWIGDFCNYAPDRLIGVAELPTWDMSLMLEELRRVVNLGMRAVLLPIVPGYVGDWSHPAPSNYLSPYWEPLWTELERSEITIVSHIDAFAVTPGLSGYNLDDRDSTLVTMMTNKSVPSEMVASMMVAKVFDRHPGLQICFNETGIGWAAHFITWVDVQVKRQTLNLEWERSPKQYFNDHIIGSFLWDSCGVPNRDIIGVESMCWCSDYPENYGTFGKAQAQIDKDLAGVSQDERHAILAGNAVRAFRL